VAGSIALRGALGSSIIIAAMIQRKEVSPNELEIAVDGHIAGEANAEFQAALDDALKGSHRLIALNFERLESLSSTAIGKILHFRRRCDETGRQLVIRRCNPRVRELLAMIRFDSLIAFEK
jgi:anti-anti-sigma factor